MWTRYVVTFCNSKEIGIVGMYARVIDVGSALIRVVPCVEIIRELPAGREKAGETFLIKRTTLLAEFSNPECHVVILSRETRIRPKAGARSARRRACNPRSSWRG